MRRLAALLAAMVAFGLMSLSLPWVSLECRPPECSSSSGETYWGGFWGVMMVVGFYLLVPSIILTAILVAVLRLRDASSPDAVAVRSALGETRAKAVRSAAKRGLTDAVMWVGAAYLLTGVAHLAMLASTGAYPLSHDGGLWLTRLAITAVAAACLLASHTIDALRANRTPAEQLRPEPSDPRDRRLPLGRRASILAVVAASAGGVLVGANMAFDGSSQAAPRLVIVVASVAAWMFGLAIAALAWGVLMPIARDLVPRAVSVAGSLSNAFGAREVGAVLQVRASTRWLSSSRVIVVLAGLAFLVGLASTADTDVSSGQYTPIAAGVPTSTPDTFSRCDANCDAARESLYAQDGVGTVVPAGSTRITRESELKGLTFINPTDLDGVDDALAARLREEPSAVLMPSNAGTVSIDDFDSLGINVTSIGNLPDAFPRAIANRAWVEAQMGALDSTYFYAYPAPGWTPDQTYDSLSRVRSDDYPWTIEQGNRSDWVDADSSGGSSTSGDTGGQDDAGFTSIQLQNVILVAIFAAVILVPIAAVATAAVLRRRRDDATMAALGASVQTLRITVVVEAAMTAALALASGLLGGALTHIAVVGASMAVTGLYGMDIGDVLVGAIASVNWLGLLGILGVALLVFIAVSWIASRSLHTLTPVEALRPATDGALR